MKPHVIEPVILIDFQSLPPEGNVHGIVTGVRKGAIIDSPAKDKWIAIKPELFSTAESSRSPNEV